MEKARLSKYISFSTRKLKSALQKKLLTVTSTNILS